MLDVLMIPAQDFRAFGHESYPAKNDELTILLGCGTSRKAQGIPTKVRKIDNFLPLVMVTENN
jgi:hypothetical protein